MSPLILIQMASYTLVLWAILEVLKQVVGHLVRVLNGEVPAPKPSVKLCALCTHPHAIQSSGSVILAKLKRVLWLGFLIAGFSSLYLPLLSRFTSLLVGAFS